ncbi:MAG: sigma-70 family RNA polymerase sigma factor [Thermogutta sp.]|nr:sigma-70 family RNA polymerase sigma factor [Thermogutta sp.]
MLEVRSGNAAAFEELVQRYQARVLAVLENLLGDRHQAEDLAQEVFLRVYRARNTYQPNAKFATWLFKIVNNLALNQLRNRSRRREMSTDFRPDGSQFHEALADAVQVSSGQMPARRLDKLEMRDILRLALESLNERQRLAILLCKFEGMSYADIAAAMDMSPKAVKSLLSRARVRLKDILQPYIETGKMPISLAGAESTMDWSPDADDSGGHAETPKGED